MRERTAAVVEGTRALDGLAPALDDSATSRGSAVTSWILGVSSCCAAYALFAWYVASRSPQLRSGVSEQALVNGLFSENAFYYRVFEHLVQAPSWSSALAQLRNNDWFTHPQAVDLLRSFNFFQELAFALAYRALDGVIASPVRFYSIATLLMHSLTIVIVLVGTTALTQRRELGWAAAAMLLACTGELFSRFAFGPALRENASVPFLILNLVLTARALGPSSQLRSSALWLLMSAALHALTWQFASVTLAVKHVAVFGCVLLGACDAGRARRLLAIDGAVAIAAAVAYDQNAYYRAPYYLATALGCFAGTALIPRGRALACLAGVALAVGAKVVLNFIGGNADGHMLAFLVGRVTGAVDYEAWLYQSTPSFGPIEGKQLAALFIGLGAPGLAALIAYRSADRPLRARPDALLLVLCAIGYLMLGVLVRRLAVVYVPVLALAIAVCLDLARARRPFSSFGIVPAALLVAVLLELNHYGRVAELSVVPELDEVLAVMDDESRTPVVASDVVVSAAIALRSANRVKTVLHPYYESAENRERTKRISQAYGHASTVGVHRELRALGVDYLVLRKDLCGDPSLVEALDAEDGRHAIDIFCVRNFDRSIYFRMRYDGDWIQVLSVL